MDGRVPPHRRKNYHRRGPWACDECRLRKRKCDGAQPCRPCVLTDYACTYESRGRIQAPTQRIRHLEDQLRKASSFLQVLKQNGCKTDESNIDSVIQELQCESTLGQEATMSAKLPAKERKVQNMMAGSWQLLSRSRSSEAFFGASSGVSFICRTLELFLKDESAVPSMLDIYPPMLELFDNPLPEKFRLPNPSIGLFNLPDISTSLQLLDSLFDRCSLVAEFLQKTDLREMIERLTQQMQSHHQVSNKQGLILLHSVLALGYLYHVPLHRIHGCRSAQVEALKFFTASRHALDITECNDLMSLQTLLCLIIFLISTSRMIAAHPYLGIACSSALRLGLHSRASEAMSLSYEQRQKRTCTFVTILKLDVYCNIVLGLPPFIDLGGHHDHLKMFEPESQSFMNQTSQDSQSLMELSFQHFELLNITLSGLSVVFPRDSASSPEDTSDDMYLVDLSHLEDVGGRFQSWAENFSSVLRRIGGGTKHDVMKYEIEMTLYFGQILLYKPFLHYFKRIANGEALSRSQSQHALACIKISSITITRSQEMAKRGLLCSASWMPTYSIFLSVVCLVFLIAAHNGTSKPSEAWKKAQSGIRLLTAARCHNDGATACLTILKRLISELSHTVDFDLEQIEASTARFCQFNLMRGDSTDENDTESWPSTPQASRTGHPRHFSSSIERPSVPLPSHIWQEESLPFGDSVSGSSAPESFWCDADKMLAQAQGTPIGHRMDEFVDMNDYS